ncbi:hypothetical protein [Ancylobacter sp.]|uniref:hypothetical protein n=1 Tax=Ancylobacter sp. TaxID=1872567 RepID=UPI003C79C714
MNAPPAASSPVASLSQEAAARGALVLIGLMLAWRLLLAAFVPLVPDEAYYALWAQGFPPAMSIIPR